MIVKYTLCITSTLLYSLWRHLLKYNMLHTMFWITINLANKYDM